MTPVGLGKKSGIGRKLAVSARDDTLSWLSALGWAHAVPTLHWLPIPFAIASLAVSNTYKRLHSHSPRNFTAWRENLDDLPNLYHTDWSQVVHFQYAGRLRPIPQLLIADASQGPLQLRMHFAGDPFKLSDSVSELTQETRERIIRYLQRHDAYQQKTRTESMCLSVSNCIRSGDTVTLDVRSLSYDDVLATHYALDVNWLGRSDTLRNFLLSRTPGTLGPLKGSLMPNIMGVDVLLFTPSGSLILQRRSRRVAVRPGEICASFSGGAAREDITSAGSLKISREGAEELAIHPKKIKANSIRFLGLARDFISHGVVESYFCADTLESDIEIRARARSAPDKKEHSKVFTFDFGDDLVRGSLRDPDRLTRFFTKMDELIDRHGKHFSIPLFCALALWQKQRLSEG